MYWKIYIIIAAYFLLGAIAFIIINRNKEKTEVRQNWTKYLSYLVIVHILFFSIISGTLLFRLLAAIIALTGFFELFMLHKNSGYQQKSFFLRSILIYGVAAYGFLLFSGREQELTLFTFLVIFIFDSFSQIIGQLWGKRLLFPKISPQKTVGGLVGGGLVALASALLIHPVTGMSPVDSLTSATGIVGAAFLGDMLTSLFKRVYRVKDFSNLIPGHGGLLDRFDSLIAGGAWITLWHLIEKL